MFCVRRVVNDHARYRVQLMADVALTTSLLIAPGDLAFQVQFGMFSEDQQESIMNVLTRIFCYKHSKVQSNYLFNVASNLFIEAVDLPFSLFACAFLL